MEAHFVTCLYNGLNATKIGGRLNRDRPYKYSLSTIAKTNEKIICYTSPREIAKLRHDFPLSKFSNLQLLPWDLYEMPFHERVDKVRSSNLAFYRETPEWRDRCVEIMWGKFLFIKDSIKNNMESEYVYWIDAGLSHPGIIHSRFNPHYEHNLNFVRDLDKSTYHLTFQNDLIFTDMFMQNLIDYTGPDKILNVAAKGPQHARLSTGPFKGSVIGGIFGGKRDLMVEYCDMIISMFEDSVDNNILYKEEQLMTEVLNQEKMPLKYFVFDTWYHPDWGEKSYSDSQTSFCDFFDEIKK